MTTLPRSPSWTEMYERMEGNCRDLDDENIRLRRHIRDLERKLDVMKDVLRNEGFTIPEDINAKG